VKVGVRNVSPERSFSLSEGCERDLREFFAPEYRIYEQAIGGESAVRSSSRLSRTRAWLVIHEGNQIISATMTTAARKRTARFW
jgi:hypothetical protein